MNKRGFTLVEITVAAVIFAVTMASVYSTVASFRVPVDASTKKLRAMQLAKKRMEILRHQVTFPFSADLDPASPNHGSAGSPLPDDPEFPGYKWWYRCTRLGGGSDGVQIDLTVRTP